MVEFLIAAIPLLLLLGSLLLGLYPGCEAAMRLAEHFAAREHPRATLAPSWRRPQRPATRSPQGGLLIAFRLAQRPPPLSA
jgi:hypothetical protein